MIAVTVTKDATTVLAELVTKELRRVEYAGLWDGHSWIWQLELNVSDGYFSEECPSSVVLGRLSLDSAKRLFVRKLLRQQNSRVFLLREAYRRGADLSPNQTAELM